jgi:hypothetical protein
MTAQMVRSIGRNLAYNLNYLPPDKLGWKPAPTAKSAFEIVTHLAYFQKGMAGVASGAGWTDPGITPPTNLEEARALILQTTEAFAAALEALPPEGLNRQVELPFGTFPLARVATMAAADAVHHHGQIAYIQTLLGDPEDHFDPQLIT